MDLLTANDQPGEYPASYYTATARPLDPFAPSRGALTCDVCVVGGGFTGLSTALHLVRRGYDVILLEAQRVGFGASGRNGGQVGQGQRLEQDALEKMLGRPHARALWQIAMQSVDLVRKLCAELDMPFHDGIIYADNRARDVSDSWDYVDKLNSEYNYEKIRPLDADECCHLVNSPIYHGGMIDMGSGHIHPLQFAFGLARLAVLSGVRIFERSKVTSLDTGDPSQLRTADATISARYVVLGCNGYLGDLQRDVAARVMPINNYILATEPMTPEQQEELVRDNLAVADSKFVVNYFRFSEDHRLLFGGGESYGYRFPRDIAAKVRKPMLEIFPQLRDTRIDYAWGGTLAITMNRMPHFARLAGNVLSLSGFSGHGVAMGTLSGQIAAEAIAGQAERFDLMAQVPSPRFPGGTALRSPLLILAMLWYGLRDRL
ncbi:MAG: NAD(P)/FAD-dependent oxidoreductase [Paracoccaceae bacterium]